MGEYHIFEMCLSVFKTPFVSFSSLLEFATRFLKVKFTCTALHASFVHFSVVAVMFLGRPSRAFMGRIRPVGRRLGTTALDSWQLLDVSFYAFLKVCCSFIS